MSLRSDLFDRYLENEADQLDLALVAELLLQHPSHGRGMESALAGHPRLLQSAHPDGRFKLLHIYRYVPCLMHVAQYAPSFAPFQAQSAKDRAERAINRAYVEVSEMIEKTLGERIARIRNDHGLSQEDLERTSGVARRTIQNIEGNRVSARFDNIVAIAKSLDVSLDYLAFGKSKPEETALDLTPTELAHRIAQELEKSKVPPLSPAEQEIVKVTRTGTSERKELLGLVGRLTDRQAERLLRFARDMIRGKKSQAKATGA